MKYKLLILDIDGTLVKNHGYSPSQKVVEAIAKAKEFVKISLCTGRTKEMTMPIIQQLQLHDSYHVVEGGTRVMNEKGAYEYEKLLTYKEIEEIVKLAGNTPMSIGYCIDGNWLDLESIPKTGKITNVSLNSNNKKQTDVIMAQISGLNNKYHIAIGTHISIEGGHHIMISQKGASKELGIQYIQKKLGITKEETVGVGDMHNDLPLLLGSGLKIAIGDGSEELKMKADYIAPPFKKDPVAHIIQKFIL